MPETPPQKSKTLLDESDAARLIGVCRTTLLRWRQKGESPPYFQYPSGRVLYVESDVLTWLKEHREGVE
jgi:predicted DNA-binding transcriptional regulator AlpA